MEVKKCNAEAPITFGFNFAPTPSTLTATMTQPHNETENLDQKLKDHMSSIFKKLDSNSPKNAKLEPTELYVYSHHFINKLTTDFNSKNVTKCNLENYQRLLFNERNITLAKVLKQCEFCTKNVHPEYDRILHDKLIKTTSREYDQDRKIPYDSKYVCVSVDLQNLILHIDGTTFQFFQQSFIPVGKNNKLDNFSAVWHEGISGITSQDLISIFDQFFRGNSQAETFRLWLNSSLDFKENWRFFSYLVYIINSSEISAGKIEICFYELGHGITSAFDFNHVVEEKMKNLYSEFNFNMFLDAIKKTTEIGKIKLMNYSDFSDWQDFSSDLKLKKLKGNFMDLVKVVFIRGSTLLFCYDSFGTESKPIDFYASASDKSIRAKPRRENAGISKEVRDTILEGPNILSRNLEFWKNLNVRQYTEN